MKTAVVISAFACLCIPALWPQNQAKQLVRAPKRVVLRNRSRPNKPHWKYSEIAAHKGHASLRQTVVSDDFLHADYIRFARFRGACGRHRVRRPAAAGAWRASMVTSWPAALPLTASRISATSSSQRTDYCFSKLETRASNLTAFADTILAGPVNLTKMFPPGPSTIAASMR